MKYARKICWYLGTWWAVFSWFIFASYYERLLIQAQFLYRQSELYRERWQTMGFQFAEDSFVNVAESFFRKAHTASPLIRWKLFWDGFFNREHRIYYMDNSKK